MGKSPDLLHLAIGVGCGAVLGWIFRGKLRPRIISNVMKTEEVLHYPNIAHARPWPFFSSAMPSGSGAFKCRPVRRRRRRQL